MANRQDNGYPRQAAGRGRQGQGRGPGHGRLRMDEIGSKRKRVEEEQGGDPALTLLSVVLRIGDRLPVSFGTVRSWLKQCTPSAQSLRRVMSILWRARLTRSRSEPDETSRPGPSRCLASVYFALCKSRSGLPSCSLQVTQTILDCAVEVSTKVHIYATLVGELTRIMHSIWHAHQQQCFPGHECLQPNTWFCVTLASQVDLC